MKITYFGSICNETPNMRADARQEQKDYIDYLRRQGVTNFKEYIEENLKQNGNKTPRSHLSVWKRRASYKELYGDSPNCKALKKLMQQYIRDGLVRNPSGRDENGIPPTDSTTEADTES